MIINYTTYLDIIVSAFNIFTIWRCCKIRREVEDVRQTCLQMNFERNDYFRGQLMEMEGKVIDSVRASTQPIPPFFNTPKTTEVHHHHYVDYSKQPINFD